MPSTPSPEAAGLPCPLITEDRGGILVMTINRPDVRNAIDHGTAVLIAQALERLDADDGLLIGVLTGAGGNFSSGMDLGAFGRGSPPSVEGRGFAGMTRRSADKPLIAAVEGYAFAGGFEMAIACDLIVAADDARFALPEVRRGLLAAAGALLKLPRRMPYHVVMELALTGDTFDAGRLHALGLVNRVVPPGGALEAAIALAGHIIEGGPLAIAATKRILTEQQDWTLDNMWEMQDPHFRKVADSLDAREGAAAFKERRKPRWRRQ